MKIFNVGRIILGAGIGLGILTSTLLAQTEGSVQLEATISDYDGRDGEKHYTAVWVTTESGSFIRTIWEQGPPLGGEDYDDWPDHCSKFWNAKNGDNVIDGFSGATATSYSTSSGNNPIDPTWDCRDKNGALVPDGNYKFWIQYAENSGQGPYTTDGLLWTKGPTASAPTYSDQGTNFINMSVTWTPVTVAPTITSAAPPSTGTVGVPYTPYLCTATGTAPITFTATGLPTGMSISAPGVIFGTPTAAGLFNGTITASNGTAPDATQAFSIDVVEVPVMFATAEKLGGDFFLMTGTGPANGRYTVLSTSDLSLPPGSWTEGITDTFNGAGEFSVTVPVPPGELEYFFRLRVP